LGTNYLFGLYNFRTFAAEIRPEKCNFATDIRPEKCDNTLNIRPEKCDLNEKKTL
jgi:hypothetical protein